MHQSRFDNKMAPSRKVAKANQAGHSGLLLWTALVLLMTLLVVLGLASLSAEANTLVSPSQAGLGPEARQTIGVSPAGGFASSNYNNLDNLISDFLDDAGNRLKKSKLNSMRQIKPTLRFGRRSDPMMAAASLADQLASMDGNQDQYESNQRLLAAELAAAANY